MYCMLLYFILNSIMVTRVLGDPDGAKFVAARSSAIIDQYVSFVSIEKEGKHICGGSLIKPNIVLTAGHCLAIGQDTEVLALMSVKSGLSLQEDGEQSAKIIDICIHPEYVKSGNNIFDYDVGVAKLDHSLILSAFTQLIELQPKGVDVSDTSIGAVVDLGGHSETEDNTLTLQYYNLTKVNQDVCRYTSMITVPDRFTCFSSENGAISICKGHSGSALVVDRRQIGIVSSTQGCGLPLFLPNLYTRVENEEIRNHIDQCISKF